MFEAIEGKSFLGSLFDMSFTSYATPRLAKLLYVIHMTLATFIYVGVILVDTSFLDSVGTILGVLIGIIIPLIYLLFARVFIEAIMAIFSGVNDLRKIAQTRD